MAKLSIVMPRVLDALIALSLLFWGVAAVLGRDPTVVRSPIVLSIMGLNAVVAWLFLRREIPRRVADLSTQAVVLPSVLIGPLVLHRSSDYAAWPAGTVLAFVFATAVVMVSLLCLGRSFAIFPAQRSMICQGPYRWLRHPAYAGELTMMLVAASARIDLVNSLLVVAAVTATILRIVVEERFLRLNMKGYAEYSRAVPTRLVPGLW